MPNVHLLLFVLRRIFTEKVLMKNLKVSKQSVITLKLSETKVVK